MSTTEPTLHVYLEIDVVHGFLVLLLEVRQHLTVVLQTLDFEGLKCISENNPSANSRAKVLRIEGP